MLDQQIELMVVCESCRGTGVYVGNAEQEGEGVVCIDCKGEGGKPLKFTLFHARKRRADIRWVKIPEGLLNTSKTKVSYQEFLYLVPCRYMYVGPKR